MVPQPRRAAAVLPALLLLPIAWPRFAAHTGIALVTIVLATAGMIGAVLAARRRPASA